MTMDQNEAGTPPPGEMPAGPAVPAGTTPAAGTAPGAGMTPGAGTKTNGMAIAGLILAFLVAPIGLILSLVGLIQAGRQGQKGKGLAVIGIVVSLVLMIGAGTAMYLVAGKVSTLADPGCTTGKAAVLDNADKVSNQSTAKEALQATVDGLASAQARAKHSNVREAMKALADDYRQLVTALDTGTAPPPGLQDKIDADAAVVDKLCSIGDGK